jgi:hypothetical protein
MSEGQSTSPGPTPGGDWREERRREREERRRQRHEHGWGGPWIGGVILILVGVIFLLQNFGLRLPDNWWTVFILIPAAASLAGAWRAYENNGGTFNGAVAGPLVGGLILLAVFLALFFGLNWGAFWPVILIIIGLGVLARAYWPR